MAKIKKEQNELTIQQELDVTRELEEVTELQEYAENVGMYGRAQKHADSIYTALASLHQIAKDLIRNDKIIRRENARLQGEVARLTAQLVILRKKSK